MNCLFILIKMFSRTTQEEKRCAHDIPHFVKLFPLYQFSYLPSDNKLNRFINHFKDRQNSLEVI